MGNFTIPLKSIKLFKFLDLIICIWESVLGSIPKNRKNSLKSIIPKLLFIVENWNNLSGQ
jgi:hypothetical protein